MSEIKTDPVRRAHRRIAEGPIILLAALVTFSIAAQAQQSPVMARTWQVPFMSPGGANANLGAFYNEFRCGEDPSNTNPATCSDPHPRTFDMVVNWRRCDWGGIQATSYYQCLDSYLSRDGGAMDHALSFAPFKTYNPTNGDGGDILINDGATVWIEATHDGTDPPGALQFFCSAVPGSGWVMINVGDGINTTYWSGETIGSAPPLIQAPAPPSGHPTTNGPRVYGRFRSWSTASRKPAP